MGQVNRFLIIRIRLNCVQKFGAEICELVGCVLLYSIYKNVDPGSHTKTKKHMMVWLSWIRAQRKNVMVLEKGCIGCLANLDLG